MIVYTAQQATPGDRQRDPDELTTGGRLVHDQDHPDDRDQRQDDDRRRHPLVQDHGREGQDE
jgi:hypothetical protein